MVSVGMQEAGVPVGLAVWEGGVIGLPSLVRLGARFLWRVAREGRVRPQSMPAAPLRGVLVVTFDLGSG